MISTKDCKTVSAVDVEHLSQEVASEVESLIDNYKPEKNLTSPVEMKILLTVELPVFQNPRPYCVQKIVDDLVQEWLEEGTIKPSTSEMRYALSRVSCFTLTDSLFHRLREAQLLDDWTKVLKNVVETKGYEDFYIVNGVLFKDSNKELLVVPSLMETEIIQNSHKQGYFSSKKTQDLIEKSYYIPKLKEKVARVVDSCAARRVP